MSLYRVLYIQSYMKIQEKFQLCLDIENLQMLVNYWLWCISYRNLGPRPSRCDSQRHGQRLQRPDTAALVLDRNQHAGRG